jgi:hypothetical protein
MPRRDLSERIRLAPVLASSRRPHGHGDDIALASVNGRVDQRDVSVSGLPPIRHQLSLGLAQARRL